MIIDAPRKEQFLLLASLWQEAFGDTDAFLEDFKQTAFDPRRCRCITVGEEIVAALYWFHCSCRQQPIAYLYAVATKKTHRGQGLCRTLMDGTHRHLQALGYQGAFLVPGSKELFDFYAKGGYQPAGRISQLSCSPSSDPIQLEKIDPAQYAALRREFLPEGGVLQEEENIRFLHTMAEFYTGKDFLLAARRQGDTLVGVELLGDPATAPALVGALGCTAGQFRCPGTDKAFGMYYPFPNSTLSPPEYFGLAFD